MKKTILAAIIAATALVPPAALAQDRGGRWSGRGDRSTSQPSQGQPQQQRNWGGQQRQQQAPQVRQDRGPDRGGPDRSQWRQQRPDAGQPSQQQQQWRGDRGGWNRGQVQQGQPPQAQPQAQPQQRQWRGDRGRPDRNQGAQQWRGGGRPDGQANQQWRGRPDGQTNQQWRGNRGQYDRGNRDWNRNGRNWNDNRGGNWNRGDRGGRWNNNWRNDNRYDWRGWRNSHRNFYRLPRYYAPGGWGYGYRRFGIGFTLSSILFAPQYWINDPYYYRLPEVDGPYRWVRYYNDALLVDIETGEVVDTIYDIFW